MNEVERTYQAIYMIHFWIGTIFGVTLSLGVALVAWGYLNGF